MRRCFLHSRFQLSDMSFFHLVNLKMKINSSFKNVFLLKKGTECFLLAEMQDIFFGALEAILGPFFGFKPNPVNLIVIPRQIIGLPRVFKVDNPAFYIV